MRLTFVPSRRIEMFRVWRVRYPNLTGTNAPQHQPLS